MSTLRASLSTVLYHLCYRPLRIAIYLSIRLYLLWVVLAFFVAGILLVLVDCHRRCCWPPFRLDRSATRRRRRTVLITGMHTAKGLTLARACHRDGHRVISADFGFDFGLGFLGFKIPSVGRFSRAKDKFYTIPAVGTQEDYAAAIRSIIMAENVDVWVPCTKSVFDPDPDFTAVNPIWDAYAAQTVQERNMACVCVQSDVTTTDMLSDPEHFLKTTFQLGGDLRVPETHTIASRDDLERHLYRIHSKTPGRKFVLKQKSSPSAYDPTFRQDPADDYLLLPPDDVEEIDDVLDRYDLSAQSPCVLQEYISCDPPRTLGNRSFRTHCLVVRGSVVVFLACKWGKSEAVYQQYDGEPAESPYTEAMLAFTRQLLSKWSPQTRRLTGHFSLDFIVDNTHPSRPIKERLYAISCAPRVRTAVSLLSESVPAMSAMVGAYLSVLDDPQDQYAAQRVVVGLPAGARQRYQVGRDLLNYFASYPAMQVVKIVWGLPKTVSIRICLKHAFRHITESQDATFVIWDPLPFFLHQVLGFLRQESPTF